MKKEYKSPAARVMPLLTKLSLCQTSIEGYSIVSGDFDEDSD